ACIALSYAFFASFGALKEETLIVVPSGLSPRWRKMVPTSIVCSGEYELMLATADRNPEASPLISHDHSAWRLTPICVPLLPVYSRLGSIDDVGPNCGDTET